MTTQEIGERMRWMVRSHGEYITSTGEAEIWVEAEDAVALAEAARLVEAFGKIAAIEDLANSIVSCGSCHSCSAMADRIRVIVREARRERK